MNSYQKIFTKAWLVYPDMTGFARSLVFLLIVISSVATTTPASAEIIEAQWKVYQIRFNYYPFRTFYSCDAIERKLERLLLLLGARNDARVEMRCFGNDNLKSRREHRSYKMLLAFAMPVPADKTDITKEIIPAEWKETRVAGSLSRYLDGGDCELVDQFQRFVIPHLEIKKSTNSLHCSPMRRPSSKLRIKMTSLRAVEKTELEETGSKERLNTTKQENVE
jgi:hypothetical protein